MHRLPAKREIWLSPGCGAYEHTYTAANLVSES